MISGLHDMGVMVVPQTDAEKRINNFRRGTYLTREDARRDVFEYIHMLYNPTRKHTNNGMLSPTSQRNETRPNLVTKVSRSFYVSVAGGT